MAEAAMNTDVNHPGIKAVSVGMAWFSGMTWGEFASMLAAVYTALLITEWLWKKIIRPFLVRRGKLKGSPEFIDSTMKGDL